MARGKHPIDQPVITLDGSTYDILGDSILASDGETDDGNTASLTSQSVDGRTPDDLSSIADTDHLHEDQEEHFEHVSRKEAAEPGLDLATDYDNDVNENRSDDEGRARPSRPSTLQNVASRLSELEVEDSGLTARPVSPEIEFCMPPSLQQSRAMTDSEISERHRVPHPRVLTWDDCVVTFRHYTDEGLKILDELVKDAIIRGRHDWKNLKLTYHANMQDRESLAFYLTTASQLVLGLLLLGLVGWLSANLTITFNGRVRSIQPPYYEPCPPSSIMSQNHPPVTSATIEKSADSGATRRSVVSSVDSSLGQPMQKTVANEPPQFTASILGDNHIILSPPKSFLLAKKQPELFVDIARDGQKLKTTLEKSDNWYAAAVPREQAWGILEVTVFTKSKPIITQQFKLNFGNPWLKMGVWQASAEKLSDSVRGEWAGVSDLFSNAVKQARKELQEFRTHYDLDNAAAEILQTSQVRATDLMDRAALAKKDLVRIVDAQSKALSLHVASLREALRRDVPKKANRLSKDMSRLYSSMQDLDPQSYLRELQHAHVRIFKRAHTNAENIIRKLKQKQEKASRRVRSASADGVACDRKCKRAKRKEKRACHVGRGHAC